MSIDNLCNSCTNIGCEFQSGIVRTECAFYMPPHIEPDNCGNYVAMQPTVEAIPKSDYEARLKADMVAMLEELNLEIDEMFVGRIDYTVDKIQDLIQQKINSLKEQTDGENN